MFVQVAALFYIGTTKSHPPIPEHLSVEAKDFLLRCLQKYVILILFKLLSPLNSFALNLVCSNLCCTGKLSFSWSKLFLE